MSDQRTASRVPVSSNVYARACLQKTVAAICAAHGWQSVTREALHVLTVLFQQRLLQLARATNTVAKHLDSDSPTVADVQYAFDAHGVTLKELAEYASFCSKPAILYPSEQLQFPAPTVSNLRFDPALTTVQGTQNDALNGITDVHVRPPDADRTLLERAFPHIEPYFPNILSVPNWKALALARIRRRELEEVQRDGGFGADRPEADARPADKTDTANVNANGHSNAMEEEITSRMMTQNSEDTGGLQPVAHAFEQTDADELERIGAQLDAEHAARFSDLFRLFGGAVKRRDRRRFEEPTSANGTHLKPFNPYGTQPRSPTKALLFPFRRARERDRDSESESEPDRSRKRGHQRSESSESDDRRRQRHGRRHMHRHRHRSHRHSSSRRHRHRHRDRERERDSEKDAAANGNGKSVILPKLKLKLCDPSKTREDRFEIVEASASAADADLKLTASELGEKPPVTIATSNAASQLLGVSAGNASIAGVVQFEGVEKRALEVAPEPSRKELSAIKMEDVVSPSSSRSQKTSSSKSRKKPSTKSPKAEPPTPLLAVPSAATAPAAEIEPPWTERASSSRSATQLLVSDTTVAEASRQPEPSVQQQADAAPKLKLKFKLGPPPRSDSTEAPPSAGLQSSTPMFGSADLATSQSRASNPDSNPFLAEWSESARLFTPPDSAVPQHTSAKSAASAGNVHEPPKSPQLPFFQPTSTLQRGMLPTMVRGPEFSELAKMYSTSSGTTAAAKSASPARASGPTQSGNQVSPRTTHPVETQLTSDAQNQPLNLSMKPSNGKRRSDAQAKSAVSLTPIVSKSSKKSRKPTPSEALEESHPIAPSSASSKQPNATSLSGDSRRQSTANQQSSSFVTMTAPPTVWSDTLTLPPMPIPASSMVSAMQPPEPSPKPQSSSSSNNKRRGGSSGGGGTGGTSAGGGGGSSSKSSAKASNHSVPSHQTASNTFANQNQSVTLTAPNRSTKLVVDDGEVAETDADGKIWLCPQCNAPDDGSPMVCCDECNLWFHFACVGLVVEPSENEQWFCPPCSTKQRPSSTKRPAKSTKQSSSSSRKAKRK